MRAPRKMKPEPERESGRPKPAVCRRLFADETDPIDQGLRDNMFNQITEQISRRMNEMSEKYNFDFRNEVPLEGDWTWERVAPEDTTAPAATDAAPADDDVQSPAPASEDTLPPPASDPPQPPTVPQ